LYASRKLAVDYENPFALGTDDRVDIDRFGEPTPFDLSGPQARHLTGLTAGGRWIRIAPLAAGGFRAHIVERGAAFRWAPAVGAGRALLCRRRDHAFIRSFLYAVQFAVTARSEGGAGLLKLPRVKTKCRVRV